MEHLGEVDSRIGRDQVVAAERSIYEMLVQDCPDMPDEERRQLAAEGALHSAALHARDLDGNRQTTIYCICAHPQRGHIGGAGKCKDAECGCEGFVPDTIKLEVQSEQ